MTWHIPKHPPMSPDVLLEHFQQAVRREGEDTLYLGVANDGENVLLLAFSTRAVEHLLMHLGDTFVGEPDEACDWYMHLLASLVHGVKHLAGADGSATG